MLNSIINKVKNVFGGGGTPSGPKELKSGDFYALLRNALIAGAGGLITYLINALPGYNFGELNYIIFPLVSGALDLARRWLISNTNK